MSNDSLEDVLTEDYLSLSKEFDQTQIQESWSWRIVQLARRLVFCLLDEKGEFKRRSLLKAMSILEENLHSLVPTHHQDSAPRQHVLNILRLFSNDQEMQTALKRIKRPENHQGALNLIRETLFLEERAKITDGETRKAVLAALLTSLRQNVGSCFATAPAIMIQQDQPLQFLSDMGELLGTGRLKRVFEGVEYAVPLSIDWGVGDLCRPIAFAALDKMMDSPGMRAAFEATGITIQEVEEALAGLGSIEDPFGAMTADRVIKMILLRRHQLTEEEVKAYRERPVLEGFVGEIFIQTPHMQVGKGRIAERFLSDYYLAQNAFKRLTDNPLLKAWEFTLASFSESKADFAKWNLYMSLGVQAKEPFGIGESLYHYLQERVDRLNEEIAISESRYDHLFAQVKYLEGRLRSATSGNEVEWLRADYRLRQHEIARALSERDEAHEQGRRLSGLYPFLIEFYGQKIQNYFQEVYDASMHDVTPHLYDDAPAGFRLLFKHGRTNTALWTPIQSAGEYIQALTTFFTSTEGELRSVPEMEGLEKELSELVTVILTTIKRPEFLEYSFYRLAKAYREPLVDRPLENLERVKRKPWAYISGGTMSTLIQHYYGSPNRTKEAKRWVESENELLAFLIDTLKELPRSVQQLYENDSSLSLLAFSPTHAFLCKPGWKLFKDAWKSDLYTYTWIRDRWQGPILRFLDEQILDGGMIEVLIEELFPFFPAGYQPLVKGALKNLPFSLRPHEFRDHVLKALSYEKWLGRHLDIIGEQIDSLLYRSLPLFPETLLPERLRLLFESIDEIDDELQNRLYNQMETIDLRRNKTLTSKDLINITKEMLIFVLGKKWSPIPFHARIVEAMQKKGLGFPAPLLVADTNWVKNVFGFTVNPGSGRLEFWRFDESGCEGRPIAAWRCYLNGSTKQEWGLYVAPGQYGQFPSSI